MHNFRHVQATILLFGVIIIITLSSHDAKALMSNGTNESSFNMPFKPIPWITILSFIISVIIVSGIFIFVAYCLRYYLRRSDMEFGDIVRDGSGFPSLARFQFLLWTFIIMFAVLSVYFIRLFLRTPELPNEIPTNLLILTGISVAVPFVSNPVSSIKYGDRKPTKGILKKDDRRSLATMLMENGKPTVSRFQMFAWTIISIIIYLGFFFSQTTFLLHDANKLTVPDIPQVFVLLMGLSQTAYVGNKATISKSLTVLQVAPNKAAAGADVIIIGTNFGTEKGSVLFEDGARDAAGNQVIVQPNGIKEWQENKIHISVPRQGLTTNSDYYIRVVNGGTMSYKGGGQDDEAKFTMTP